MGSGASRPVEGALLVDNATAKSQPRSSPESESLRASTKSAEARQRPSAPSARPALVLHPVPQGRHEAEMTRFREKKKGFTGFRAELYAEQSSRNLAGVTSGAMDIGAEGPKAQQDIDVALSVLPDFPLFEKDVLLDIFTGMSEATCAAGGEIFAAGVPCAYFVLLIEGQMNLGDSAVRYANEEALLGPAPTKEALLAETDCRLWVITRLQYQKVTVDALRRKLERGGSLLENITEIPGLKELPRETREAIAAALRPVKFKRGDFLMRQGAEGDTMFFIEEGKVSIRQQSARQTQAQTGDGAEEGGQEVAQRGRGEYIGEGALLDEGAAGLRNASAVAVTESVRCLALGRSDFQEYMGSLRELFELNLCFRVLRSLDLTKDLDDTQLSMIVSTLEEGEFKPGEYVVHQGEVGDMFYIVKDGTLECTINEEEAEEEEEQRSTDGDGGKEEEPARPCRDADVQSARGADERPKRASLSEPKRIGTLITGDYFGEGALLTNAPRRCNVFAAGPAKTKVWALRRSNFERFLSDGLKEKLGATFLQRKTAKDGGSRPNVQWEDLQKVRTLGSGSYGTVDLVRHRVTGETYALKRLRKATVVAKKQQRFVRKERELMSVMHSPFLVNLQATFNKGDSVYMMLEVCLGGELYSLMKDTVDAHCAAAEDEDTVCGCFELATQCRFFMACIVLAVEYMHSKGIIHRDIKPENLLLNEQGYLKLADFGFAKMIHDQRTYSLCGTPEYTAPEVYKRSGHSKGVDWWGLGVILYEMASGFSPFHVNSQNSWDCYIEIAKYEKFFPNIQFPSLFDDTLCDLLLRLMHPNPSKRFGTRKLNATHVKQHPFFGKCKAYPFALDWDAIESRSYVLDEKYRPRAPESGLDANNFEVCGDRHEDDDKYVDESMMESGGTWYNDF